MSTDSTEPRGGEQRLYGLPHAEVLYFEPNSVYESEIEDQAEDYPDRVEIEEWSVHPPEYHLPKADDIIDWMTLWAAENGEGDEAQYDQWQAVGTPPDVLAAAEALRTVVASKIEYRMANEHLRSLWVTWTEDGEPLLDGEPMYVPAPKDRVVDLMEALEQSVAAAKASRNRAPGSPE